MHALQGIRPTKNLRLITKKKVLMTYENRAGGKICSFEIFQEVHAIHIMACWDLTPHKFVQTFRSIILLYIVGALLGLCSCWNNWEEQKCQLYRKVARSVPVGVKEREEETRISNGNWGIEVRKPVWQTAFEHRNKRNYPNFLITFVDITWATPTF